MKNHISSAFPAAGTCLLVLVGKGWSAARSQLDSDCPAVAGLAGAAAAGLGVMAGILLAGRARQNTFELLL